MLLVVTAVGYFGFNIGEAYFNLYRYQDRMKGEARFAANTTDALVRLRDTMKETQALGFARMREAQWALGRGVRRALGGEDALHDRDHGRAGRGAQHDLGLRVLRSAGLDHGAVAVLDGNDVVRPHGLGSVDEQ